VILITGLRKPAAVKRGKQKVKNQGPGEKQPKRRKRGQGEGSIFKRKDGRWASTINLGYLGGKLRRKTFYGKTRAEVAEKLTGALGDKKKGIPISTERQTIGQFLDRWLRDCAKPRTRPSTFAGYEFIVSHYLKPELGKIEITQLSPQRVQAHLNEFVERGYSGQTARHARSVLRSALNQALRWGLVARNVATLVDSPNYTRLEVKPLRAEEVKKFLEAMKGDRLEALYL
jgi:integrase